MGRIKEISRKSAHTRKRNPVLYLICEGSETEIRYFKRFRSRGCNIDIIVLESAILYSGWRVWKTELRPKQKGKVKKIAFK